MDALNRASGNLMTLLGKLNTYAAGDHQGDTLSVLLELQASDRDDPWLIDAIAQLSRRCMEHDELRACVNRCIGDVSVALVTERAPRRTTILPPPSGERNELRLECEAARASLSSVDLAVNVLGWHEVVPKYSTVPASAFTL